MKKITSFAFAAMFSLCANAQDAKNNQQLATPDQKWAGEKQERFADASDRKDRREERRDERRENRADRKDDRMENREKMQERQGGRPQGGEQRSGAAPQRR
jgi:hypothetical protein